MGLVRAETVDLYRGGLPINPLPARKGKTFDRTWYIARWKEGASYMIISGWDEWDAQDV